ncbi:MAG: glycoside hydrolase family 88 protein, partial [Oscillospiraceae bacterium]|nr:glycoside hydrolase family 88 protein [Oscillospiraceae bacterium]
AAIRDCQKVDDQGRGFWTQSMLAHTYSTSNENPQGYETSGTAFFTYGFLWGINSGILPEDEYIDCALRGWKYLTEVAIQDSGRVGYVQPVGARAGDAAARDNTQDFGVGATLLAACEMARYSRGMEGNFYPYLQKRTVATASMKVGSPYIYANNKVEALDAAPVIADGRTLVPVRAASEALGAQVTWDEATQQVGLVKGDSSVVMTIGQTAYTVSGEAKEMDTAPVITDGRTLVPLRAASEALGKVVYWNGDKQLISIGQKENLFYDCEAGMVDMLDGILTTGQIPTWTSVDKGFVDYVAELRDAAAFSPVAAQSAVEPEYFNCLEMAFDGDPGTRYANNVEGSTVTFDFGEVKNFTKLGIYFWHYEDRTTNFKVEISSDGVNFTEVYNGKSTMGVQVNVLDIGAEARYVRLTNGRNSENEWFNILEIVGYGDGVAVETNL